MAEDRRSVFGGPLRSSGDSQDVDERMNGVESLRTRGWGQVGFDDGNDRFELFWGRLMGREPLPGSTSVQIVDDRRDGEIGASTCDGA